MSDFQDTLDKLLSDPEQMEKIAGIAKALTQGAPEGAGTDSGAGMPTDVPTDVISSGASLLSSLDPKTIGLIGKLIGEYNSKNDKEALLRAITPYLTETRRGKIEQAAKMAKLARIARVAMMELGGEPRAAE
ncbi:MAG: hypothetical protein LBH17_08360 [Oscillospiraceae bacterium]|jgi:hypothetical protein|nr:hypothetical protein [Oscillospiraceae bacterium]